MVATRASIMTATVDVHAALEAPGVGVVGAAVLVTVTLETDNVSEETAE